MSDEKQTDDTSICKQQNVRGVSAVDDMPRAA